MVIVYNTAIPVSFMIIIARGVIYLYVHKERSAFHTLSTSLIKIKASHVRAMRAAERTNTSRCVYVRGLLLTVISAAASIDAACCGKVKIKVSIDVMCVISEWSHYVCPPSTTHSSLGPWTKPFAYGTCDLRTARYCIELTQHHPVGMVQVGVLTAACLRNMIFIYTSAQSDI